MGGGGDGEEKEEEEVNKEERRGGREQRMRRSKKEPRCCHYLVNEQACTQSRGGAMCLRDIKLDTGNNSNRQGLCFCI